MKIEILGTGCSKCKMTAANAEKAAKSLGVNAEIVKVENINDIMNYGVSTTRNSPLLRRTLTILASA